MLAQKRTRTCFIVCIHLDICVIGIALISSNHLCFLFTTSVSGNLYRNIPKIVIQNVAIRVKNMFENTLTDCYYA